MTKIVVCARVCISIDVFDNDDLAIVHILQPTRMHVAAERDPLNSLLPPLDHFLHISLWERSADGRVKVLHLVRDGRDQAIVKNQRSFTKYAKTFGLKDKKKESKKKGLNQEESAATWQAINLGVESCGKTLLGDDNFKTVEPLQISLCMRMYDKFSMHFSPVFQKEKGGRGAYTYATNALCSWIPATQYICSENFLVEPHSKKLL